jgi:hypothetical protein
LQVPSGAAEIIKDVHDSLVGLPGEGGHVIGGRRRDDILGVGAVLARGRVDTGQGFPDLLGAPGGHGLSAIEGQLDSLGLSPNAVMLWTTRSIDAAVARFRAEGHEIRDEDIARLSLLKHRNRHFLGHCRETWGGGGVRDDWQPTRPAAVTAQENYTHAVSVPLSDPVE